MSTITETCGCGASLTIEANGTRTSRQSGTYGGERDVTTTGVSEDAALDWITRWRSEHRHGTGTDEVATLVADARALLVAVQGEMDLLRKDVDRVYAAAERISPEPDAEASATDKPKGAS